MVAVEVAISHSAAATAGLLTCLALILLLHFPHFRNPRAAWDTRLRARLLATQAALTYLPLYWLAEGWGPTSGLLVGALLWHIPRRWLGATLAGLVTAAVPTHALAIGLDAAAAAAHMLTCALIGLVLHGLGRLGELLCDMRVARTELSQRVLGQERQRLARDLHDLLGYSISAITLKGELSRRLIAVNSDLANEELASLVEISRQALADVRAVSSGYPQLCLHREASSARLLLCAAGIPAEVDASSYGALHTDTSTIMATVLREGVTNILRHSNAQSCSITAVRQGDSIRLTLTNDGVSASSRGHVRAGGERPGGGLENLSERLAAIDGRLTTRVSGDTFQF